MTKNPFNSIFENSLRLLILLDIYDMPQTVDMLYAIDFMTVYGKSFGITETNLNGDNEYRFSEFASRREPVRAALKEMVLNGTAQAVSYKKGLAYIITPEGEDYCESLESDYAKEYSHNAEKVISEMAGKTERAIISDINKKSAEALRKGVTG